MTFAHTLQPELYECKFQNNPWRKESHTCRWVVNFARNDEPSDTPTHVVDLMVSWLSNIRTRDLLYGQSNLDASENHLPTLFGQVRLVVRNGQSQQLPCSEVW